MGQRDLGAVAGHRMGNKEKWVKLRLSVLSFLTTGWPFPSGSSVFCLLKKADP